MRPVIGVIIVAVWFLIALTSAARAESVYLRDGGAVECESFWRKGDLVVVKVNRDVVVEFGKDEIDLKKTMRGKKQRQGRHVPQKGAAMKPGGGPAEVAGPATAAESAASTPPAAPSPQRAPDVAKPPAPAAKETAAAKPEPAPSKPAPSAPEPTVKTQPPSEPVPAAVPLAAMSSTAMSLFVCGMVAFVVLMIAAQWKIFEKAGVAGWKCLIPIYNLYLLFLIAGKPGWWLILTLIPLVSVVVYLLAMLSLAGKFGKGPVYGVGLFLLPFIFFPLLAFDGSEYSG